MVEHTLDEGPEVKIEVHSTEYPDQVVIDITITGADEAVRNKFKMALLEAMKKVTEG